MRVQSINSTNRNITINFSSISIVGTDTIKKAEKLYNQDLFLSKQLELISKNETCSELRNFVSDMLKLITGEKSEREILLIQDEFNPYLPKYANLKENLKNSSTTPKEIIENSEFAKSVKELIETGKKKELLPEFITYCFDKNDTDRFRIGVAARNFIEELPELVKPLEWENLNSQNTPIQKQTNNSLPANNRITFSGKKIDLTNRFLEKCLSYFDSNQNPNIYEKRVQEGLSMLKGQTDGIIKAVILHPLTKSEDCIPTYDRYNLFVNALIQSINIQNNKPTIAILDFVDTLEPKIQADFYTLSTNSKNLVQEALDSGQLDTAKEIVQRAQKLFKKYPDDNLGNTLFSWDGIYSKYPWYPKAINHEN